MSTTTPNLGLFKYNTSTDASVPFNINTALNNNWDLIDQKCGATRNIGEIVNSTVPLIDAGLHLLDGSLINESGIYSAFVTYMAGLVSGHPELFTTESDWQTSVTEFGSCDRFVYNSTNNTVRLPKRTTEHGKLIKAYSTESSFCRIYEDGWCEQGGYSVGNVSLLKPYKNDHYTVTMSNFNGNSYTAGLNSKNNLGFIINGNFAGNSNNTTTYALWQASGYIL